LLASHLNSASTSSIHSQHRSFWLSFRFLQHLTQFLLSDFSFIFINFNINLILKAMPPHSQVWFLYFILLHSPKVVGVARAWTGFFNLLRHLYLRLLTASFIGDSLSVQGLKRIFLTFVVISKLHYLTVRLFACCGYDTPHELK
jgi:hypothetical protein